MRLILELKRNGLRRTRGRFVLLMILAASGLALSLSAQTDKAKAFQRDLVGTWKLVSYFGEDVVSGAKGDVMGAHPSGYVHYGQDDRMLLMIVGGDRKKPAGSKPTPEEAEALITSMLAYAGTYTIDADAQTVTHHIEISWDQTRAGQDHLRKYKLEGDRLTLITEPSTDPATGRKTIRTVVWERVK